MRLPEGWERHFLDAIAKRGSGHTPDKSMPHYYNGGIKWVSLADSSALDSGYICKTKSEISQEGIKNSSAVLHPAGTVILSRDAGVGKSAVLALEMAVSQHFIVWQCDNTEKLHNWFLYYWLQMMKPEFERQAVGSAIKTIGLPYFKKLKIVTPQISEQQKIAQILSTWDKAIEKLEALIAAKQKRKKALMQQLLTGKKRFAGFDECWESIRLRDVLKGKKCKGKIVPTNAELKGLPYIGSTSFEGDFGLYSDSEEAVTCSPTDILMLWDGENAGKVATNLIGVVSSTVVRCRLNTANANNEFIAYCLLKDNYKIRAIREGSGIPHMPGDFEYWYEFQLPIFKEQQKIAATLSTADREIQVHQNQLTALKQQKKALMQQLLTGKKRVMIAEAA